MDTPWILHRLRAKGLTQGFLAAKLGITTGALNHKLHGRRPTTLAQAADLAAWLEMDAQEVAAHFFDGNSCIKQ